jgi:Zn-dependent protease with chaperone function
MPRRSFRTSAWSSLVSAVTLVPILVGTAAIVVPAAYGLHRLWPTWGVVALFVLWWAPTPLYVMSAPQNLIARAFFGCREPTGTERRRLEGPWRALLQRAGVPGRRYRLMATDSDELNACTTFPRTVVVTSYAAASLPHAELEAVLGHELGHRLGGRSALAYVRVQLMLPGRALWWLLGEVWLPVAPMWRRAVAWHRPIGFLLTFLIAIAATAVTLVVGPPAVLAAGGVALARLSSGRAEFQADWAAVRLGLGPQLLHVLERLIESERGRAAPSRSERLFAMAPLLVRRAQRIRRSLATSPVGPR